VLPQLAVAGIEPSDVAVLADALVRQIERLPT
jgi:hypothetical protein